MIIACSDAECVNVNACRWNLHRRADAAGAVLVMLLSRDSAILRNMPQLVIDTNATQLYSLFSTDLHQGAPDAAQQLRHGVQAAALPGGVARQTLHQVGKVSSQST